MAVRRSNPAGGDYLIQKIGGTSLGRFLHQITEEIVPSYLDLGNRVALVCSARSGSTKSTGTTTLLLRAADEAVQRTKLSPASLATAGADSPLTPSTPNPIVPGLETSTVPLSQQVLSRNASFTSGVATPTRGLSGSTSASKGSAFFGSGFDDTPQAFNSTVDRIKEDHLQSARAAVKDEELLAELLEDLESDCERLRKFLLAAQIIDEISARTRDIVMGLGERLSCLIVVAALKDKGIDAELVSLENIVDTASLSEELRVPQSPDAPLNQTFYDVLAERIGRRLLECEDRVPVVTGFFGVVPGSLLSQVGRGYTDLCAALCAVGVNAAELQIWKEVDGIFTADPRKVPTARLLSRITPEEAAELTYYGSEVIHPFTMDQVIRAAIPIRIKNVQNPKGEGTIIFPDLGKNKANGIHAPDSPPPKQLGLRTPTAVTFKDNMVALSVRSKGNTISNGFLSGVFGVLDRHGVVVDLISTSQVNVSMAINEAMLTPKVIHELQKIGGVTELKSSMVILSLVGKLQNMVGIAGKMFTTLAESNVNIEMISQGASEMNISCVIEKKDAIKALNRVHHELLGVATPTPFQP